MSSMRNAVQRRNHKERGQPAERARLGLLEKHKDYSARAKDYNTKKRKLNILKKLVENVNPDEFAFGMLSRSGPSRTGKNRTGTVNGDRGNQVLSQEASRLYKTQDLGYVRTARNQVAKEVRELERQTAGIKGNGKKIVFVDDEQGMPEEEAKASPDTMDDAMDDSEFEDEDESQSEDDERITFQKQETQKALKKLAVARERLKALTEAEQALEMQQARMARSPTVGGITKAGVKYKIKDRKR